ncbi:uncharacterized protein ACNLHF_005027 isoform 1-T1 [Anomaloglossus baeobatrachus]
MQSGALLYLSTQSAVGREAEDHCFLIQRTIIQTTKKMDCPAKLYIYHIAIFPDFRIAQNTEKRRKMVSKKIKNSLDKLAPIHNYTVKFPNVTDHQNPATTGEIVNFREKVDQRVRKKVRELYRGVLRTVSDIMIPLGAFVAEECFVMKSLSDHTEGSIQPEKTSQILL